MAFSHQIARIDSAARLADVSRADLDSESSAAVEAEISPTESAL